MTISGEEKRQAMKDSKRIIKRWEALTEHITREFCDKYNFDYDQGFWMGDAVGRTFCVDDDYHYIEFSDIIFDLKYDTKGEYKEWYSYDYDLRDLGVYPRINHDSWLKGLPRPFTREQINELFQIADKDREKYARVFYEQNRQKE